MACQNSMKAERKGLKRGIGAALLLALLLGLVVSASASPEEPLLLNMFLGQEVIEQPSEIDVHINVINVSGDERVLTVTLLDPDGEICTDFGENGSIRLGPGISASYSGVWQVTEAQLNAGIITYHAAYTQLDGSGREVSKKVPVSQGIRQAEITKLVVEREIYPESAVPGQLVTIVYNLKNTGILDLSNIEIQDQGVENGRAYLSALKSGREESVSYSFVMGDAPVVTEAEVSYTFYEDGQWQIKMGKGTAKEIGVKERLIWIELWADKQEVAPGDTLRLSVVIENQSGKALRNILVSDETLGDLDSGFSLDGGKRYEGEFTITLSHTDTFQLRMDALTAAGEKIILISGPVTVRVEPAATAEEEAARQDMLRCEMSVSPENLAQPAPVRVNILLSNLGEAGTPPLSVTLYGPNDEVCPLFGDDGTATLAPGASASYAGTWNVTQDQLTAGRVVFWAEYTAGGATVKRPIAAAVTQLDTDISLAVERRVEPGVLVPIGENAKLYLTLTNRGNVTIDAIVLADPGVIDEEISYSMLAPGESTEISYDCILEGEGKTTRAKIDYLFTERGELVTKTVALEPLTIRVDPAQAEIAVSLSASLVSGSEAGLVELTCTIENKSRIAFEEIRITEPSLGIVADGLSVKPGETIEVTKRINTEGADSDIVFTVSGMDSYGNSALYLSNAVRAGAAR